MIDRAYKNQYVSLLLNLIKQLIIKAEQCNKGTDRTQQKILIDIANQKD
jgi:hypothetical protein